MRQPFRLPAASYYKLAMGDHRTLGPLFDEVAAKHAENIALSFPDGSELTYGQLGVQSDRFLAGYIERGIQCDDVVAIFGQKTPETFVAIIAALKLGAPYVILDPDSPHERLSRILDRCQPKLVLVHTASQLNGYAEHWNACQINNISGESVRTSSQIAGNQPGEDTPAYIMFTSGSTGFPKGAAIRHSSVINLIDWSKSEFGFGPGEVLTNVNPLFFDNSVFDLYSSLFSGAMLVPIPKDDVTDPKRLTEVIDDKQCTSWFSVPTLLIYLDTMRAFGGGRLSSIRRFIFGGEGYPKPKLKRLYDAYHEQAELVNVYGPTECTCICSVHRITDADFDDMSGYPTLGKLIQLFGYYLIDSESGEVVQSKGELCLTGPNVGIGYLNDPQRTEESFIASPLKQGEVSYRTGDIVSVDSFNGFLNVHGRADNQIKHMGYRIELDEIDIALSHVEGVDQGISIYCRDGNGGKIVGVVSPKIETESINRKLKEILPSYMIPDHMVSLEQLPKNENGKISRKYIYEYICRASR